MFLFCCQLRKMHSHILHNHSVNSMKKSNKTIQQSMCQLTKVVDLIEVTPKSCLSLPRCQMLQLKKETSSTASVCMPIFVSDNMNVWKLSKWFSIICMHYIKSVCRCIRILKLHIYSFHVISVRLFTKVMQINKYKHSPYYE